jgi:putative phosphonate metabolism protein
MSRSDISTAPTTTERTSRFALYFVPSAASWLHRFGSEWLGRDVIAGTELAPPAFEGVSADEWRRVTASPRLYGFHATLKPPFRLSPHRTEAELMEQLRLFAAARRPFDAPPLRVARISNFVALVLRSDAPMLSDLADACVRTFDDFRALPSTDERERRLRAPLTERQRTLLDRWGYPYVFDEWRFHMTLATDLDRAGDDRIQKALDRLAAPQHETPLRIDGVCLFEQPCPGAPFHVVSRFPFPEPAGA